MSTTPRFGPRIRPAVHTLKPYVPGVSLEAVRRELGLTDLVKMNQNENPLGPSPSAVAAVRQALSEVSLYPDGTAPALRARLAELWNLEPEWFLVGNGSDEVFRLLAETYLEPGDRVVVPVPSFAGYALVAELMGAEVIRVPLVDQMMDLPAMTVAASAGSSGCIGSTDGMAARMLFLCRPNNPTGTVFPPEALEAMLVTLPSETLVVLDEAYREFDETEFASRDLVATWPNLVITRTFSKIFGLAGLRLGYGVMRPELSAPLRRVRDPFSVNVPAVAAGIAALADQDHVQRSLALVHSGKRTLYALFERLGLPYLPTEANFVLFATPIPAVEVYDRLVREGVLIRPCSSFGLPHHLRVTVGTAEQNELFAAALMRVSGG